MNLRFSSKDIRLRVTQEEALRLSDNGSLSESLPLPVSKLEVEISVVEDLTTGVSFLFEGNCVSVAVDKIALESILNTDSPQNDSISVRISDELSFAFEIDLFSRKKAKNG